MKKTAALILSVALLLCSFVTASAAVEVSDVFGNDYIEYDVNFDGFFDIKDFVRAKKYYAEMPVTVNLNFTDSPSAQALADMRKELLEKL